LLLLLLLFYSALPLLFGYLLGGEMTYPSGKRVSQGYTIKKDTKRDRKELNNI